MAPENDENGYYGRRVESDDSEGNHSGSYTNNEDSDEENGGNENEDEDDSSSDNDDDNREDDEGNENAADGASPEYAESVDNDDEDNDGSTWAHNDPLEERSPLSPQAPWNGHEGWQLSDETDFIAIGAHLEDLGEIEE